MSGLCSAHRDWERGCDICEQSTPPLTAIRLRAQRITAIPSADGRYWDERSQAIADRDALLAMLNPDVVARAINDFVRALVGDDPVPQVFRTDADEVERVLFPFLHL